MYLLDKKIYLKFHKIKKNIRDQKSENLNVPKWSKKGTILAPQADYQKGDNLGPRVESDVVWLDLHGKNVIHPKSVL